MKVRDLKKILSHVKDDVEVVVKVPCLNLRGEADLYRVESASYVGPWGLGGDEFQLVTDDGFYL
jgi:hypothetical protein